MEDPGGLVCYNYPVTTRSLLLFEIKIDVQPFPLLPLTDFCFSQTLRNSFAISQKYEIIRKCVSTDGSHLWQ